MAGLQTKNITYKSGDLECHGYLAWDDSVGGARPGVLVVHEWWGLGARRLWAALTSTCPRGMCVGISLVFGRVGRLLFPFCNQFVQHGARV